MRSIMYRYTCGVHDVVDEVCGSQARDTRELLVGPPSYFILLPCLVVRSSDIHQIFSNLSVQRASCELLVQI
jgi:hypothetical protein